MKKEIFKGVGTAIVTPFSNDKVDFISLDLIIQKQLAANVDALIVLGTTGEPATINESEREEIIKFVIEKVNKRAKVIVGCGSNNTKNAIKLYNQAEKLKADGALTVTPFYNKCTKDGLLQHYTEINNSGSLPIIVYNVPSRTNVNIDPLTLLKLSNLSNVCGVKEASGNIEQILQVFRLCRNKIAIYSGEDSLNSIFLALGAKGVISVLSNLVPKSCKTLLEYANLKQYEQMFILQEKLLPLCNALFNEVNPIPVKAGLNYLGLCKNELRLPLTPISKENFNILKEEMDLIMGCEL